MGQSFDFSQTFSRAEINLVMGHDQEKDEIDAVANIIKNNSNKGVLDIGANIGAFSIEMMKKVPEQFTFHLFEPIPDTYVRLKDMLLLNSVDSNKFNIYNCGLSNEVGEAVFYLPAANGAASLQPINDEFYLKESDEYGNYTGRKSMQEITCKIDTMDSFCLSNNIEEVGFIKIDVEGNEKNVILGGLETIRKNKPIVYCELLRKHCKRFGYHPNEVIDLMEEIGYTCNCIVDGDVQLVKEINEHTVESNFIFIPKE